jgi:hypothetical protein
MIEIAITLLVSAVCFCAFVFLFLFQGELPSEVDHACRSHVAGLKSVYFPPFDVLAGYEDYRALVRRPELKSVSTRFRKERRRIVLMWLQELRRDLRLVWEFRKFLVRNGLPVTLRDELAVGLTAFAALTYIGILSLTVFVVGPFVPRGVLRKVRAPVERLSIQSAALLSRTTNKTRLQIEEMWAQHLLKWNAG